MNSEERIYFDDRLTDRHDAALELDMLLRTNYIYTTVNTADRRPLFLERHLRHAADSYETLYGLRPEIDEATIVERIGNLLYYGMYPEGGNTVDIYLLPDAKPHTLIVHNSSTVERGYFLSPLKLRAAVANFEIPFERHKSAVSLAAASFADDFARRHGADVALRANRAGRVLSSGDSPLFAIRDNRVFTPSVERGARPSVERELMFELCRAANVEIEQADIEVSELGSYDELMIFCPTGLRTIARIDEVYYLNVMAHTLERHLGIFM